MISAIEKNKGGLAVKSVRLAGEVPLEETAFKRRADEAGGVMGWHLEGKPPRQHEGQCRGWEVR